MYWAFAFTLLLFLEHKKQVHNIYQHSNRSPSKIQQLVKSTSPYSSIFPLLHKSSTARTFRVIYSFAGAFLPAAAISLSSAFLGHSFHGKSGGQEELPAQYQDKQSPRPSTWTKYIYESISAFCCPVHPLTLITLHYIGNWHITNPLAIIHPPATIALDSPRSRRGRVNPLQRNSCSWMVKLTMVHVQKSNGRTGQQ